MSDGITVSCSKCGGEKDSSRWRWCSTCRSKQAAYMRKHRERNPQNLEYMREWNRRRRRTVLDHYGGRCACCGEDEYQFLAIDHINGGGEKHRAKVGQGSHMVNWLIDNNYPEGFRVLCHNCNQAIGYYGECPHARAVKLVLVSE